MANTTSGAAIVSMVVALAVTLGFGLVFLDAFQGAVGNTSPAYSALDTIITQIQNNLVWVGLIVLAGLGGLAYLFAKHFGIVG